ncbi:hypothetical protein [Deinococcus phoenicis]|uniref:hypothetical protein n=1 Tax=Deinococcus phoenicis TaxID=1476583 RepID=UPI0004B68C54|nr:hypothetical protein [Deinococcus phoenicis]
MDDLYGFQPGELVKFLGEPRGFARVLRRASAEGRLLIAVNVSGRWREFAVHPSRLKPLTRKETPDHAEYP